MGSSSKILLGCGSVGMAMFLSLLLFLAIWQFLQPDHMPLTMVSYSDFIQLVNADPERDPHVENVKIKGREISFTVKDPKSRASIRKMTTGPESTEALAIELTDHHIQ